MRERRSVAFGADPKLMEARRHAATHSSPTASGTRAVIGEPSGAPLGAQPIDSHQHGPKRRKRHNEVYRQSSLERVKVGLGRAVLKGPIELAARFVPLVAQLAPQVVQSQRLGFRGPGINPHSRPETALTPRIVAASLVARHANRPSPGRRCRYPSERACYVAVESAYTQVSGDLRTAGSDDATRGRSRHKRLPLRQANHPCPLCRRNRATSDRRERASPRGGSACAVHGGNPAGTRVRFRERQATDAPQARRELPQQGDGE